jgi:hypothetical protein
MNGGDSCAIASGASQQQHGHRDSDLASMTVNRLRMVAIEFVT